MRVETVKEGFEAFRSLVKEGLISDTIVSVKVGNIVQDALKVITSDQAPANFKLDKTTILSDVESVIWANKSARKSPAFKTFLRALNELGIPSDEILMDTVLHIAGSEEDSDDAMREFVEAFPECKTVKDSKERNVVSVAVEKASMSSITALEKAGFDFTDPDIDGNTALHHLAMSKRFSEADYKMLSHLTGGLSKLESVDLVNHEKCTPLHLCIMNRNKAFFDFFVNFNPNFSQLDGQGRTPLHMCFAESDSQDSIDDILESILVCQKVDLNMVDSHGDTALHLAAANVQNSWTVALLLQKGANPDIQNKLGETALHILARNGQSTRAIDSLLAYGADFSIKSGLEQTALEVAIENKQWLSIVDLLKNSSDLMSISYEGKTLVDLAIENESTDLLRLLITKVEKFMFTKYHEGQTILHRAVLKGSVALTSMCFMHGATIAEEDDKGHCVSDFAVESGSADVLVLLFKYHLKDYLNHDLDQANRVFWRILELKNLEMVEVFSMYGLGSSEAMIDGKPLALYAYEHENWDLIDSLSELMYEQDDSKYFDCFGLGFDKAEFVAALIANKRLDTLNAFAYFGFIKFQDTEVSQSLIKLAVEEKDWDFICRNIERCTGCEQLEIEKVPLVFVAMRENAEEAASVIFSYLKLDPLIEFDGERLIDAMIGKRMIEPLAIIVDKTEDLSSLKINLNGLVDIAFERLEACRATQEEDDFELSYPLGALHKLINYGVDVSSRVMNGLPLLHYFVRYFRGACLDSLIEKGALVHEKDSFGRTALYYALQNRDTDAFGVLLQGGAQVRIEDWDFTLSREEVISFIGVCPGDIMKFIDVRIIAIIHELEDRREKQAFSLLKADLEKVDKALPAKFNFLKSQNLDSVKDIPDVDYPGEPFAEIEELRSFFAGIEDSDLEGIAGIGEDLVTVAVHRENFERFLKNVQESVKIVGVNMEDPSQTYAPICRTLKHLALKLSSLDKAEQITLLTRFSRIDRDLCIEPYLKASRWVYGSLVSKKEDDLQGKAFEMGDPLVALRRELYVKITDWRDHALRTIIREESGELDTHARNWVYRYYGPHVGTGYDEEDMYIDGHGLTMLAEFLNLSPQKEVLIEELATRFASFFTGYVFQNMLRFFRHEIQPGQTSSGGGHSKGEVLIDYFHSLINLKKAADLKEAFSEPADISVGEEYLKMKGDMEPHQTAISNRSQKFNRLSRQLEIKKSQAIGEGPEAKSRRDELIKDLELQVQKAEALLTHAQKALIQAERRLKQFKQDHPEVCDSLDEIEEKAIQEHATITEKHLSYNEESGQVEISKEGLWEFFTLFFVYEKTPV
ncbi:MAG: hypothetical protein S4CHLAM6_04860 [Chlamydiae bacterium]|nr:hypothetical protein [Chlamydiota bacterium]